MITAAGAVDEATAVVGAGEDVVGVLELSVAGALVADGVVVAVDVALELEEVMTTGAL